MKHKLRALENEKIQKMMSVIPGWELKITPQCEFSYVVEACVEKTVDGIRTAFSYSKHTRESSEPLACVVFCAVRDAMEHDKIPGEPPYVRDKQ